VPFYHRKLTIEPKFPLTHHRLSSLLFQPSSLIESNGNSAIMTDSMEITQSPASYKRSKSEMSDDEDNEDEEENNRVSIR
jgi:hypothetical protein